MNDFPALVSSDWLQESLGAPDLVVLDGSFKLPGQAPLAHEDYAARHIPQARFFDIDVISDSDSQLPHMLPSPEAFAAAVRKLGISNDTAVVVYDTPGLMSAARIWWTFRVFGHSRIAVLDGGLKTWMAEGREVTAALPQVTCGTYSASYRPQLVSDRRHVLDRLGRIDSQIIDARSSARFDAIEKEARPGLRSGHIPGSLNLPFTALTDPQSGKVRPLTELSSLFDGIGAAPGKPTIVTCGSGVTACTLAFAMHLLGWPDASVYDGAWTEWGGRSDTPVAPD